MQTSARTDGVRRAARRRRRPFPAYPSRRAGLQCTNMSYENADHQHTHTHIDSMHCCGGCCCCAFDCWSTETRIFYPSLSSPYPSLSSPKSLDGARFVRVTPCRRAVPRRILSRCRVAHAVLGGRAQAGVPVAGGGRAVARAAAKPCGVPRSLVCGKWRESWSRASEGVSLRVDHGMV